MSDDEFFTNEQIADDLRRIADHPRQISQITPYALRDIANRLTAAQPTDTETVTEWEDPEPWFDGMFRHAYSCSCGCNQFKPRTREQFVAEQSPTRKDNQ